MNRSRKIASTIISPLIFLLLAGGGVAAAEDEPWKGDQEPDPQVEVVEVESYRAEDERQVEELEQKGGVLGYNLVAHDDFGGRAHEYGFLSSSRSGGLFYRNLRKDTNLELEGFFLNEHDYYGDLLLDYRGDYRLHLRTESLYHNLDRELLFTPPFQLGRTDAPTLADYLSVQEPPQEYGISVMQDRADFRYRLHNYPLHLNLGYWRIVKEGTIQQRFADTAFEGSPNTVYAEPRAVNRQTHEGSVSLDAHLGPVDVIYGFTIREFEEKNHIPVAAYVARNDLNGVPQTVGGVRQHNEDPDSRFFSHTLKLHTSLSGGLVGSGSYSLERRENLSRLTDTTGVKHSRVNLQNAAADLVFTPNPEYSVALKYRRHELDHANRNQVLSSNFVDPVQVVKPPIDTTKDMISATLTFKPRNNLSLTGAYRGEFLKRNHVSQLPSFTTWALPEYSDTHTGSLSLFYRPVKGARVTASYSYATTDNPSYGASFQEKHEGKLLATYTRNNSWGVTGNAMIRRESNDELQYFLINFPLEPLEYLPYPLISRDRDTDNANLGVWFAPMPKLTLGANYAFLQTRVDQPVLFTSVLFGSEAPAEFSSRSYVFGVNASYALQEKLDLSLMLQQVRSHSDFTPSFVQFSATSDTSGIREITRQHTVISSLSARGEYRFTKAVSSFLEYTLRDYDEKNPLYSGYNGAAHVVLAGAAATW